MPRPGPRPYECVRRAWHSDRHHPIRGSIIQEIFRIAHELHNPDTRTNKEWQDKLPLVVLKAEEVIYSKANSEADYTDLTTLYDRTTEAIDTIIRRDDSPETEDNNNFLHPCIEAALNLGCVPRRATRSQRHNNPCSYLNSVSKLPDINVLLSNHFVRPGKVNEPPQLPSVCEVRTHGIECDLSLRLGPSLPGCFWGQEVEDVASSSSSYQGSGAPNFDSSFSSSKEKEYNFFPLGATDDPLESYSS